VRTPPAPTAVARNAGRTLAARDRGIPTLPMVLLAITLVLLVASVARWSEIGARRRRETAGPERPKDGSRAAANEPRTAGPPAAGVPRADGPAERSSPTRWDRLGPTARAGSGDRGTPGDRRLQAIPPPPQGDEQSLVVGYVLTAAGESPGAGLRADADAIAAWCDLRGWTLDQVVHDTHAAGRPGLEYAVDRLHAGSAAGLVCVRLGDLADSVAELAALLCRIAEGEGFLIALDYELDTTAPAGAVMTRALLEVGEWERRRRSARTRPGLAAAEARRAAHRRTDGEGRA
jgi:Resolvase, N terminal domain